MALDALHRMEHLTDVSLSTQAYVPALKGVDFDVAEPQLFPDVGIWHPLAPTMYEDLKEYLNWCAALLARSVCSSEARQSTSGSIHPGSHMPSQTLPGAKSCSSTAITASAMLTPALHPLSIPPCGVLALTTSPPSSTVLLLP